MFGQTVDKDTADYYLLRSVALLGEDDDDVDAGQLFDHFRSNFHAAKDWSNPKVGKRLLMLEEHGFVTLNTPGNSRGMVVHEDGPIAIVQITSAGEQALKRQPGQFKGSSPSISHKSVTFQGPVNAGNLATGDHSQQTVNVTLALGDLLKAVEKAIEEIPQVPDEQKAEAKSHVEKIKENLPHAAQLCTISNTAYALINAGLGLIG